MNIVDLAREIALEAHGGDKNSHDGSLYLLHVNAVAVGSRERAPMWRLDPQVAEAVGWLHDVVEDTAFTFPVIRERFRAGNIDPVDGASCLHAVDLLTKPSDGSLTNQAYYEQIRDDVESYACCTKEADLAHNFGRNHLIVDDSKRLRMAHKYSLGTNILGQRMKLLVHPS